MKWGLSRIDGAGIMARASPAKALVTALNLVLMVNTFHPSTLLDPVLLLSTMGVSIPNLGPVTGWFTSKLRSFTHQQLLWEDVWVTDAFFADPRLQTLACALGKPCQLIGPADRCTSVEEIVWLPRRIPSPTVKVLFGRSLEVQSIDIFYQLRAGHVDPEEAIGDDFGAEGDGSHPRQKHSSFTLRLNALGFSYYFHVESDLHLGDRNATLQTVPGNAGFHLAHERDSESWFERAREDGRLILESSWHHPLCPDSLRLAWTGSNVPQVEELSISVQSIHGIAEVGIDGIRVRAKRKNKPAKEKVGDDEVGEYYGILRNTTETRAAAEMEAARAVGTGLAMVAEKAAVKAAVKVAVKAAVKVEGTAAATVAATVSATAVVMAVARVVARVVVKEAVKAAVKAAVKVEGMAAATAVVARVAVRMAAKVEVRVMKMGVATAEEKAAATVAGKVEGMAAEMAAATTTAAVGARTTAARTFGKVSRRSRVRRGRGVRIRGRQVNHLPMEHEEEEQKSRALLEQQWKQPELRPNRLYTRTCPSRRRRGSLRSGNPLTNWATR